MAGFKLTGLGAGSAAADSATIGSPAFIGTPTAPTAATGTSSTQIATTAFVANTAFSSALPAQLGNSGKFLTTNGTDASWGYIPTGRSARTSNTILAAADNGTFVDITSGTFSQTFTAAATLGNGWWCYIRNSGTGEITLDPATTELIDGLSTYIMYTNECRLVMCTGTAFVTSVISPFYVAYTNTGANTFTKPPGYSAFGGIIWSGGSSGQRTNNAGVLSVGGASGGCFPFTVNASAVGATETVTIGAGGTGVTGVANGNAGGNSSFGSFITVFGGSSWTSGGAIGITSAVVDANNFLIGFIGASAGTFGKSTFYGGCTPSNDASADSGSSIYAGGAGGSVNALGTLRARGTSLNAGNGGAASIAGNGTDGTAPAGGGGATQTGTTSGAGGRGEVRIWGIA